MEWNWSVVGDFTPKLGEGILTALEATVLGFLVALVLGLVFTLPLLRAPGDRRHAVAAHGRRHRARPALRDLRVRGLPGGH